MDALSIREADEELDRLLADAATLDIALEKTVLEGSFYEYVKKAWHVVEPDQPFTDNWHIKLLCRRLEDCYYRKIRRVIFNVPPGTAKSMVISVLFPTWVWTKNASKRFFNASYGAHLSMRDNLRARQVIESPWYQERWPVKLADDQNAKGRYMTDERGSRVATSVGGMGTGEHPDFIIIDDPTSAQQAESETERTAANEWFDRTIASRLGRNPCIIIVMQRLHKDDLTGHLLKRKGLGEYTWVHVRWPMRYEKCTCPKVEPVPDDKVCPLHKADPDWTPDPDDPRTEPGELMFPALFPESKVKELELNLGDYGSAGQLQQRPSPMGGKLFKREWFTNFVDIAPDSGMMRMARGWDTASTEDGGDATASVKIGELFEWKLMPAAGNTRAQKVLTSTGKFYLLDPINERLSPDGVDKLIQSTARQEGKDVAQREEQEGGSSGKTVIGARTKALAGLNYQGVRVDTNKRVRSKPFRIQCEAGNVFLVGTPRKWEPFIAELCDFPTGDHDDYVDAASCAFNSVLLEEPPRKLKLTW